MNFDESLAAMNGAVRKLEMEPEAAGQVGSFPAVGIDLGYHG